MSSLDPSSAAVRVTPAVVRVLEWHRRKIGAGRVPPSHASQADGTGRERHARSTPRERAPDASDMAADED